MLDRKLKTTADSQTGKRQKQKSNPDFDHRLFAKLVVGAADQVEGVAILKEENDDDDKRKNFEEHFGAKISLQNGLAAVDISDLLHIRGKKSALFSQRNTRHSND